MSINEKLEQAITLHKQGQLLNAKTCYEEVLKEQQDNATACAYLGILQHQLNNSTKALELLTRAISLEPNNSEFYYNQGVIYQALQNYHAAIASYQKVIAIEKDDKSYNNMGICYRELGDDVEAKKCYEETLQLNPNHVQALNNLGNLYAAHKQIKKALVEYRKAIAFDPTYAEAHTNLANLLQQDGDQLGALLHHKLAYKYSPNLASAQLAILRIENELCEWKDHQKTQYFLINLLKKELDQNRKTTINPFTALTLPINNLQQIRIAKSWSDDLQKSFQTRKDSLAFAFKPQPVAKLKIGYLSCDFHDHATSHLIKKMFACHNRENFIIYTYSYGNDDGSEYRHIIKNNSDYFVDLQGMNEVESAKQIYKDGIHILVDLKGFTKDSKLGIMILRPAPITVTYLGYPGSLGASFIDYMITDAVVTTKEAAVDYVEKCVFMPNSYQVNDSEQAIDKKIPSRAQCKLPENAFVFCCFNSNYKIEPRIFEIWMKILKQVPNSVLWLFYTSLTVEKNLKQAAKSYGIDENRLIFAEKQDKPKHLARLSLADLFLDTYYVNAHTTTSDALWAGVPVLTCPGETFASRVASSLLTAIGLPELIMSNHEEYIKTAVDLATNPEKTIQLKEKLQQQRLTKPLFNTQLFTQHLELAYKAMWNSYLNKLPCENIAVAELLEGKNT